MQGIFVQPGNTSDPAWSRYNHTKTSSFVRLHDMRCPSRSQLRAPLSAWAATVRVHLPPLLLPMIHHWLWPTRTAHLYEHVEVCVALLFLRSVAGWLACAGRWSWSSRTEGGWQRLSLCPNPRVWCVSIGLYLANLQGTRAFCLISYLSLASLRPMTDIIGHARLALCVCVSMC